MRRTILALVLVLAVAASAFVDEGAEADPPDEAVAAAELDHDGACDHDADDDASALAEAREDTEHLPTDKARPTE